MSDEFGSRFGRPDPDPEDLEARLRAALRAEADRVVPAGDGLAKIRARTEGRRSAFGWFSSPAARPALAAGTLVLTLVAGTVIGLQLTGGDDGKDFADGPRDPAVNQPVSAPLIQNSQAEVERYNPDPGEPIGAEGGNQPEVTEDVTESPTDTLRIAPVTPDQDANKSDNGIPVDKGGNYVAIQGPLSGRSYNSPLTIAGVARVFEAQVTIDVSQNGKVLQRTHATATQGAPELGDWQVTIELVPGNYRIDAYALSEEDGQTKLASDSIWITIKSPNGATQPTPTPTPSPTASPSPSPTATPSPAVTPRTQEVPGTEP
jgi:hypothetical protein